MSLPSAVTQIHTLKAELSVLRLQRTRNTDLINKLMAEGKLKGFYERNLKTLFEVHISFHPQFVDLNELKTILRSYQKDEKDLYVALAGLARV